MLTNPITETNITEMLNNMDDTDAEEFKKFVYEKWGIKARRASDDVIE